jgi:hypothetical protein
VKPPPLNLAVELCKQAEPPAVVIEIPLECSTPRVHMRAVEWASDRDRLGVWLQARPDLLELIEHALALERGTA